MVIKTIIGVHGQEGTLIDLGESTITEDSGFYLKPELYKFLASRSKNSVSYTSTIKIYQIPRPRSLDM